MPRERKSAKSKAAVSVDHLGHDGPDVPPVKTKKRRGSAANAALRNASGGGGNQNGDSMMIPPPQPLGYGDTIYASNPFDDTPPMCPPQQQPPPPPGVPHGMHGPNMSHPSMMNPGAGPGGHMPPGNPPRMMGPGGGGGMGGPPPRGMGPGMGGGPKHLPPQQQPPPPGPPPHPPGMMGGPPPPGGIPPGMSGRTYPPEQSMVFNSANPNAPPIYPCGFCHKEIHDNDQAILCESGCNFWYHRICVGISEYAFTLLKQEVYAEWVCDNCLNNKNIPLIKFKS